MGLTKDLGALPRAITVSSSNYVGIGAPTPDAIFTVNKTNTNYTDASAGHILLDNSSSIGQTSIYYRINGTVRAKLRADQTGTMNYIANGGSHDFWTSGDAGTGSTKMTILSSGNVGIGTTSPAGKLHVADPSNFFVASFTGNGSNTLAVGTYGSTPSVQGFTTGGGNAAISLQPNGGNVLIGATSDNGQKLQVNGSITATSLALSGNYSVDVTTNSGWSSYQNIINPGTLLTGVTYMISVRWNFSAGSNQPYYCYCSFLWVGASTNGPNTDNEFTPICSTHTGGTGANISFRSIAGYSSSTGLQARLNSFPTLGGVMTVKAIRLE